MGQYPIAEAQQRQPVQTHEVILFELIGRLHAVIEGGEYILAELGYLALHPRGMIRHALVAVILDVARRGQV